MRYNKYDVRRVDDFRYKGNSVLIQGIFEYSGTVSAVITTEHY